MNNIQERLQTLETSGLIRLTQMEPEIEYLFKHALIQEAAYDSLLKADRRQLHAQVGFILETNYAHRQDELLGIITYHYNQAEQWEKALHYAELAANRFKLNFANEEALAYYQIGLNAAEKIILSSGVEIKTAVQQKMFAILSDRQGVWTLMGVFENAKSDLNQMIGIARELGDDARLADALNGLGYFYINTSSQDPQPVLREALEIKRRIGDQAGQADSLNTLGSVLFSTANPSEAMENYLEARQIYESIKSEDGIARSDWSIGLAEYELLGHYEQARIRFENSIAISRKLGMKGLECGGHMTLGANYVRMGEMKKAETALLTAMEIAVQIGDYPSQGWIYLYQGWSLREKKKYQEALVLIEKAIAISAERNIFNLKWYGYYSLSQCQSLTGDLEGSYKNAKYAYEISRDVDVWVSVTCRATALLAEITMMMHQEHEAEKLGLAALQELEKFGVSSVAELAGVYLSCYNALQKSQPERAFQSLQLAYEKIMEQAATLPNEEAKKRFLENVRINRNVLHLMNTNGLISSYNKPK